MERPRRDCQCAEHDAAGPQPEPKPRGDGQDDRRRAATGSPGKRKRRARPRARPAPLRSPPAREPSSWKGASRRPRPTSIPPLHPMRQAPDAEPEVQRVVDDEEGDDRQPPGAPTRSRAQPEQHGRRSPRAPDRAGRRASRAIRAARVLKRSMTAGVDPLRLQPRHGADRRRSQVRVAVEQLRVARSAASPHLRRSSPMQMPQRGQQL